MADYNETVPDLREMQRRLAVLERSFVLLSGRAERISRMDAETDRDLRLLSMQATQASDQILSAALALSSAQAPEVGFAVTREEAWREQEAGRPEAARAGLADPKWWHEQLRRFFTWHVKAEVERAEAEASAGREDAVGAVRRKLETLRDDLSFFQEKLGEAARRIEGSEQRMAGLEQQVGAARATMAQMLEHLANVRHIGEELKRLAGGRT